MKVFERNGVSWSLDEEGLVPLIDGLTVGTGPRRTHESVDLGDRRIFVKYFVEKGITGFVRNKVCPRGRKEYLLGKRLSSFFIATPRPLGFGTARAGSFILQEHLTGVPLKAAFENGARKQELLDGLAVLLKQLKDHRVRHNDLHLENVLVSGEELFLIDLHKTVVRRRHFSMADELVNLTHALTMIYDRMTEGEKSGFFRSYGSPEIRSHVEEGLLLLWKDWIQSKKKRVFSTTSKLEAEGKRIRLRNAPGRGDGPLLEVIKRSRKVVVERHDDHIRKIYRDRRRLARAWTGHVVLEYLEMPVGPRPFYVQKAPFFRGGYISMEDLQGRGVELDRFLDAEYDRMDKVQRARFLGALSAFIKDLLRKGVFHKDLKACNLFVLSDGFKLLDIEDVRFCHPGHEDLKKMFVQINTTVPKRIGVTARLRFYSTVTRGLSLDRKRLLQDVARVSKSEEIVYEGVKGLMRETW